MDYTFPVSSKTSHIFKTGAQRSEYPIFTRKSAPCISACPLHVDIPSAIDLASKGDFKGSMKVFIEENPIPGVTGRVCYHPCEGSCNRGRFDSPISIRAIERAVAESEIRIGKENRRKGERVGVVGAGPSGLACAFHLVRKGYSVTVFERHPLPGGMLRYGIPAYRLPRNILDRELNRIFSLGVDLQLGKPAAPKDLERFDAVFYSPGLQFGKTMFEGNASVTTGLRFLSTPHEMFNERVLVIGGGNVGIDAARTCVRLGADEVTVLSPETEEQMPALREEVLEAQEEGVELVCGYAPIRLENSEQKGACVLHASPVSVKQDPFRLISRCGPSLSFKIDRVIVAIGQKAEESNLLSGRNIFLGGDFSGAKPFVADALASGREGAYKIIEMLEGSRDEKELIPELAYEDLNLLFFRTAPRSDPEVRSPSERRKDFAEVSSNLEASKLAFELGRCFRCGYCIDCGLCRDFCPDLSVQEGKPFYRFDADHCKGCGVCATACPRHVIEMKEEVR